jgi:hypothetical protein
LYKVIRKRADMGILRIIVAAGRVAKAAENSKHQDTKQIINDIASGIVYSLVIVVVLFALIIYGIYYFLSRNSLPSSYDTYHNSESSVEK